MKTAVPVLYNNILYPDDYVKMKTYFQTIDAILKKRSIHIENKWLPFRFLWFYASFFWVFGVATFAYWNRFSNIINVLFIFPCFFWFLEVAIAWEILESLRIHLKSFNKFISSALHQNSFQNNSQLRDNTIYKIYFKSDIFDLIQLYNHIIKVVIIYNQLFGIFFGTLALLNLFEYVSSIYRFVSFTNDSDNASNYAENLNMISHTVSKFLSKLFIKITSIATFLGAMDYTCGKMSKCNKPSKYDSKHCSRNTKSNKNVQ